MSMVLGAGKNLATGSICRFLSELVLWMAEFQKSSACTAGRFTHVCGKKKTVSVKIPEWLEIAKGFGVLFTEECDLLEENFSKSVRKEIEKIKKACVSFKIGVQ